MASKLNVAKTEKSGLRVLNISTSSMRPTGKQPSLSWLQPNKSRIGGFTEAFIIDSRQDQN
jgi:hypothetical protein